MRKPASLLIFLMVTLTLQPAIANGLTPNNIDESNGSVISVDGFVTTKFTSVGDQIELFANTKGHSGNVASTTTIVTADILFFPDNDPIGVIIQGELPQNPIIIDTVVMQPNGYHEDDNTIMIWEGTYTVPINSLGGVYGASITMEDEGNFATDNPTQIPDKLISEIEQLLQTIDDTWDAANPAMEMKAVFDSLDSHGSGDWVGFVDDATRGSGLGGSSQLWNNMIGAGYNNPGYDMYDGARFLEALMAFLESTDLEAGMAFVTGLFVYANEFPLPRNINEFGDVADYITTFDPIENFTRFSGTEEFSVAYDAMIGSNEWQELQQALDNLANNTMVFESFQTLLRNVALLSISTHPEAIAAGFEAWIAPLAEEDYDNMTPFQKLVVSWSQMDVNVQDLDGDEFPDSIVWEYELLLNTTEGLQWQAKMETDYPYISNGFDDFNNFDIELLTILRDTFEDPVWEDAGEALQDFGDWAANATITRDLQWDYDWESESNHDDHNDDDGHDDHDDHDDSHEHDSHQYVIFDGLHPIQTTELNKYAFDVGFMLMINGLWYETDYPDNFNLSVTDSNGDVSNVLLVRNFAETNTYYGRFTADGIAVETYSFSQPLETFRPPCVDDGCTLDHAEFRIETLQPSLIESMPVEVMDEIFIVSALGVIVEQDETLLVNQPYSVESTTYDAVDGALSGANVDTAIIRLSPGLGASAASTLSPAGELTISSMEPSTLTATYDGDDAADVLTVTVEPRSEDSAGNDLHGDPAVFSGSIDYGGDSAEGWDLTSSLNGQYSQSDRGVAIITTSGENAEGLEFKFTNEMPLPSTPPCSITQGYQYSSSEISIDSSFQNYYHETDEGRQYFDPTELVSYTIDWGDGQSTGQINNPSNSHTDHGESGQFGMSESHYYAPSTSGADSYSVVVDYEFEHGVHYYHTTVWKENHGFEQTDEDGNVYYSEYFLTNNEEDYCQLARPEMSATPSPPIINEFITNGPFEIMTQQLTSSDSEGKSTLSVTPPHTGAYVSVVQSEVIRASDGETITGIGLNFGIATQGEIGITNLDVIDHFAGLPVYAANTSEATQSLTIQASGIAGNHHKATIGHLPLDLSVAFDEVTWSAEPNIQDIIFNPGETSRSVQLTHAAPLSLIGIVTIESDGNGESSIDQTLTPLAVHFGLILHNPEELSINGALGPGQTTNIALTESIEQATRLLAVASPSHGFDPATVDFSTITELISNEGLRPTTDWVGVEQQVNSVCETIDVDGGHEWNPQTSSHEPMMIIGVEHESSAIQYGNYEGYSLSTTDEVLIHEPTGQSYNSVSMNTQSGTQSSPSVSLYYPTADMPAGKYLFNSGTTLDSSVEIELFDPNGPSFETGELDENCDGNADLTDEENFDLFDDYVSRFSTIAWGQGTSADLQLPYLSSPVSEYTVIAVAQQGSGSSANLVSAVSTTLSVPNPEPPAMENLSAVFSPSNPLPGDIVLLTVTDESNNPVEGLSITVVRGEQTLTSLLSNENGQNTFPIPEGEITIRISGGQYYPVELTILVTAQGIDDDEGLPGDRDGDGYGDLLDAFPDDASEWVDTDSDSIGNNADTDDDSDGILDDDEVGANPQTNPLRPDSDNDGYCDGSIAVVGFCVAGDAFPIDSTEWSDADSDGVGDNTDICAGTSSGDSVNEFGCSDEQLQDNSDGITDDLDGDVNNPDQDEQQSSESSDSASNSMILIGGSIGLVAILIVVASLILLRNRRDEIDEKQFIQQEELFENVVITTTTPPPPSRPPVTARGEMYNGYEGLEFPVGSGNWYYRDPESGAWVEWR